MISSAHDSFMTSSKCFTSPGRHSPRENWWLATPRTWVATPKSSTEALPWDRISSTFTDSRKVMAARGSSSEWFELLKLLIYSFNSHKVTNSKQSVLKSYFFRAIKKWIWRFIQKRMKKYLSEVLFAKIRPANTNFDNHFKVFFSKSNFDLKSNSYL